MNAHIRILLDSADAEDRKQAVRLLAKIGDDEALRELALLFKNDPDAEVRDFAVKAGRYIKKTTQTMTLPAVKPKTTPPKPASSSAIRNTTTFNRLVVEPKNKPQPSVDDDDDEPVGTYKTSFADQDRARGYVEAARVMLDQYKSKPAITHLRKALEADPNLEYNADFVRLAESATGRVGHDAIEALIPPPKAAEPEMSGKRKPKPKRIEDDYLPHDGLRWKDVALDLGAYTITEAVLAFILFMVLANKIGQFTYDDSVALNASISSVGSLMPLYMAYIKSIQVVVFLIAALFVGLFSTVRLLLSYLAMHFAATVFLLGTGTFKRLIRSLTIPYIALEIGAFFLVVLPLLLSPISANTFLGMSCNFLAATFIAFVLFCLRVASAYEFGVIRGCMTFLLGGMVYGVIVGAINSLLQNLLQVTM